MVFYKYVWEVSTTKGGELFQPKDSAGMRTNGYKLVMNKLGWKLVEGFKPLEQLGLDQPPSRSHGGRNPNSF